MLNVQSSERFRNFDEFLGRMGNLFVRAGLSPPFQLRKFAEQWLADCIPPAHCVEQVCLYLERYARRITSGSGDGTLPRLDSIIRQTWLESQYANDNSAIGDTRSENENENENEKENESERDEEFSIADEKPSDQVKPWWTPPEPLRREPAQSASGYARAFLLRELAEGELSVKELNRRAKAARIAARTLDRARKELGVVARRTGFGRTGQHWVSLPKPPNRD
jgi:hypothetical protein